MKAKVEEVTKSKSGKAFRVKLNGNWYGAFLDSGLDKIVGKTIEAEITPDTGYGPGIGKWSMAEEQTTSAHNTPPSSGQTNGDRWYMPFVSNQVAHAIAAGLVTSPDQIGMWAKAAKQAASEL
jgi:hypothetical protein